MFWYVWNILFISSPSDLFVGITSLSPFVIMVCVLSRHISTRCPETVDCLTASNNIPMLLRFCLLVYSLLKKMTLYTTYSIYKSTYTTNFRLLFGTQFVCRCKYIKCICMQFINWIRCNNYLYIMNSSAAASHKVYLSPSLQKVKHIIFLFDSHLFGLL